MTIKVGLVVVRSPVLARARLLSFTTVALLLLAASAAAFDPIAIKESRGGPGQANGPGGCPLAPNLSGTCGNLHYYNFCAGYIWLISGGPPGGGFGTRFDGPCVSPGNRIRRAITYFRATVPNYQQVVDVYLDADYNNDGCPDGVIASDPDMDPGERWNCSNFNVCAPVALGQSLIVRAVQQGASSPAWATDGPGTEICDPVGLPRSFYYASGGGCVPWFMITSPLRNDNFLTWLVIDTDASCATATENTSWGIIKELYR